MSWIAVYLEALIWNQLALWSHYKLVAGQRTRSPINMDCGCVFSVKPNGSFLVCVNITQVCSTRWSYWQTTRPWTQNVLQGLKCQTFCMENKDVTYIYLLKSNFTDRCCVFYFVKHVYELEQTCFKGQMELSVCVCLQELFKLIWLGFFFLLLRVKI